MRDERERERERGVLFTSHISETRQSLVTVSWVSFIIVAVCHHIGQSHRVNIAN